MQTLIKKVGWLYSSQTSRRQNQENSPGRVTFHHVKGSAHQEGVSLVTVCATKNSLKIIKRT